MKFWRLIFIGSVLALIGSGCATVTPEQKAKWNETVPVCYSDSDCKAKWAAARQWVQNNSGYKIQIYSDDLIETYNPQQYDPKIAVSVSKNPVGKSEDGEQINVIAVKITCGNIFGCLPSVNESILSFNKFVSQAEINDPDCYRSMVTTTDKPKLGIYPQFFNSKFIIRRVCSDSPASKGGLKANDVLTKINAQDLYTEKNLENALSNIDFGDKVRVGILRDDLSQELSITVPDKQFILGLIQPKKEELNIQRPDVEQKLEALSRLFEKGIITNEEFESKKKQLLSEM